MIKFSNTEMALFDLEYGIDAVDGKKRYIASYVYETETYKVIAEVKSDKAIIFPASAKLSQRFKGFPIRYRFEGYLDYGIR